VSYFPIINNTARYICRPFFAIHIHKSDETISRALGHNFIHGCRVNLVACFMDAVDVLWSELQNNNKSSCRWAFHRVSAPPLALFSRPPLAVWMRGVMLTQAQIKHNSILLQQQSLLFCEYVTIYLSAIECARPNSKVLYICVVRQI